MLTRRTPHRHRGFSLIELMVALVLSLLVAGAVVALVLAIVHSNRQTLQSTRLNQELRATLGVVANELRRARAVADPLTAAMAVGGNPYAAMSTANAGCIVYGYDEAENGPWHVIRLDNNHVVLEGTGATRATACDPAGGDDDTAILGSPQVAITAMEITPTTTASTPPLATDETVVRRFTITLTGRLVDDDPSVAAMQRTMSSTVYVRSVGAGI